MSVIDANAERSIWTIGHSTHAIGTFIELLRKHDIEIVADVRRFPGSRRHPQFGSEALAASLRAAGIDYRHFAALGGRRTPQPDSPNTVWRNAAFRGYADHMASAEFRSAFAELIAIAGKQRCAVLCAEVLWWRCHRSLIADDLTLHGWHVIHILGDGKDVEHAFREPAHLLDDAPRYGSGQVLLL